MTNKDFSSGRYSRFVILPSIGEEGMKKIRKARATIVGAGGLGSVSAVQLTALGIGSLRIIDKDIVELSNLQRQMLYREKDIGKPKVLAAKEFLNELNPEVNIETIQEEITKENVSRAIKNVDFVVDALDHFTPRFVVNEACLMENIPFLFGAVSGLNGNTMTITRGSTCIQCLFKHVKNKKLPNTMETGIHPSIIQIIGSLQIAEATRIMVNAKPQLLDKLLFCDIGSMQFETINVANDPNCICQKYQ